MEGLNLGEANSESSITVTDNYQYPVWPLPKPKTIGDQRFSATQVSLNNGNSPLGAVGSPFSNGITPGTFIDGGSGGGGGGMPEGCSESGSIGDLNVSDVHLPCTSPRSLFSANAIALQDESGNTVELSAVNGRLVINFTGGKSISINSADLAGDETAQFREFENCDGLTWKALATEPI